MSNVDKLVGKIDDCLKGLEDTSLVPTSSLNQLMTELQEAQLQAKYYKADSELVRKDWEETNRKLEATEAKLVHALEVIYFYADEESWQWQDTPAADDRHIPAETDEGALARDFLTKYSS